MMVLQKGSWEPVGNHGVARRAMTDHPEQQVSEKPAGTYREGYGDRVVGPDRVGDRWTAAHIRDDGSATVFVWP